MALTSAQAEIRIVPTMRGFQARVTAGVKATKVDPLQVQVNVDKKSLAQAEKDVRAASDRLKKARDAEASSSENVRLAEVRLAEARRTGAAGSATLVAAENRLAQAQRNSVAASTSVQRALADDEAARNRVTAATERLEKSTARSGTAMAGFKRAMSGFRTDDIANIDRSMSSSAGSALRLSRNAFLAASAITSLGSGTSVVLALGSGLVAASGAAFLLPAGIGAAAVAYGALKVGMSGVGDALKGDAEAFAKLAPAAQSTVTTLRGFQAQWDALKRGVQGRLFQGVSTEVQLLGNVFLPRLRTALQDTAGGWNSAALSVGGYLRSQAGIANVQAMLTNGATASNIFAGSLRPITQILTTIGAVGSSFLPGIAQGFTDAANSVSVFITNAARTGQLQQWIQGGLDALKQIFGLLVNVGSIIFQVFSVANAVGGSTVQMLNHMVGGFDLWLRSAQGVAFLTVIFTTIRDTVNSLLPGVQAVWGAIVGFVGQVAPLLPQVGHAFSQIAIAAAPVIGWLGSLISTILPPLAYWVSQNAGVIVGLAIAFGIVLGVIRAATAAIAIYNGIMTVVRVATAIWTGVQWALNLAFLANPITWVVIAIIALVAAVIYAWNNFDWFRNAVLGVWHFLQTVGGWIGSVFVAIWNGLSAAFRFVGDIFAWVWNTLLAPVWNAFQTVALFVSQFIIAVVIGGLVVAWEWLASGFRSIYDLILVPVFNAFMAIANWLWINVLQPIFAAIGFAWNLLLTGFRWVYDTILVPMFNAFMAIANWLWINVLQPIFNYMKAEWDKLGRLFDWVYQNIIAPVFRFFQDTAQAFSDRFHAIVDGLRRVWDSLREAFRGPINWVIDVVYNKGIGGLWNKARGLIPALPEFVPAPLFSRGGPVSGPGTATSDSIPARLSDGEHVLDAEDVKNLGGHRGVYALRDAAARGFTPGFASGGPVSWQDLQNTILGTFPNARITSTLRPGAHDYHGAGKAIDIAGPRPMDMPFMLNVNRWIASHFGSSAELIHTQPGAANIKNGAPHRYSPAIQAGHRDHVHWANNGGKRGGLLGAWDDFVGFIKSQMVGLYDTVTNPLRGLLGSMFPTDTLAHRIPRDGGNMILDKVRDTLFGAADAADAASGMGGIAAGGVGPVADQVRAVANRFGWGAGPQWDALVRLVQKESSWIPTNANPRSTAYGLFQFLDGTWGTVGGRKTSNPGEQAEYGLRYIRQKYRDPIGALAFHNANNWYDRGGWLKPGMRQVVSNRTGKPEAVLTAPQWAVAEAAIRDVQRRRDVQLAASVPTTGDRQLFGDVHVHKSVDMDLVMQRAAFEATRSIP